MDPAVWVCSTCICGITYKRLEATIDCGESTEITVPDDETLPSVVTLITFFDGGGGKTKQWEAYGAGIVFYH